MKILVDTNILVSAVLRDRDPEKVILYLIEQPDIEWVVSSEIISEYKSVLGRDKFQLPHDLLQSWYKVLDDVTTPYSVTNTFDFPRDQKDAKFLACALTVDASFFITGDKDFSIAQKLVNTIILSVSQFIRLIMNVE